MRLDLADLRLFLCIVDAGSITRGAVRANLALGSASERLRSIEADAGVPLLQRHARGVTPTEAGEALAHHARLMLRQQALLKGELAGFAAGARGTLALHANTAALTHYLPPRLASWLAGRPRLRVELKERTSAEIIDAVTAGLAEAGIISDAVQAPALQVRPLASDHLVVVVSVSHAFAAQRTVRFAQVLKEPFIGLTAGNALQDHLEEHARAAGHPLLPRIQMKTFEGVCDMVEQGVGVGIMPQAIAQPLQRSRAVRRVALADDWARRRLCACFRDWEGLSPPMRSLLAHLGVHE